jgi:starch synthase
MLPQVVLLGSAPDQEMQEEFERMREILGQQFWQDARLHLYYDEALAHLIYAGEFPR